MDQSDSDEGNVSSSETGVSSCVVDSGDRDIVVKRTSVRQLAAKNSSSQSSSSIEEEDGVVSIDSVEEKNRTTATLFPLVAMKKTSIIP